MWQTDKLELLGSTVLAKLRGPADPLRAKGLLRIVPANLDPAFQTRWEPAVGAETVVHRQSMSLRFTAEIEEAGLVSKGGRIRRIDVAMHGTADEQLEVPARSQ